MSASSAPISSDAANQTSFEYTPIPEPKDSLPDTTIRKIARIKFIVRHYAGTALGSSKSNDFAEAIYSSTPYWQQLASETRKPLFIKKDSAKHLYRSLIYDPNLEAVIVLLNRKKLNDKLIGEGTYKKVTHAFNTQNGEFYASASLKTVFNQSGEFDAEEMRAVRKSESFGFKVTKGMPGFTQLITKVKYFAPKDVLKARYIMTLAGGGSLDRWVHCLSDKEKWRITKNLLESITLLHYAGYIHRDLKPRNILLSCEDDILKPVICDLGSICSETDLEERVVNLTTAWWASPEYAFAQALLKDPSLIKSAMLQATTYKLDVWSLGIVFFELWKVTYPPWFKPSIKDSFNTLIDNSGYFEMHSEIGPDAPIMIDRLLFGMLRETHIDRMNAQEALTFFMATVPEPSSI